ncbi:MAG: hypothetical protein KDC34_18900 [Saprospiraceae bacterium]|nr:hypothetical protein [Saprospiraceae bacterium]
MQYSEFEAAIRNFLLDSNYTEIQDLLLDWIQEHVSDTQLQNEALGHATECRKIAKDDRKGLKTSEEIDVAYNNFRLHVLQFLQDVKKYMDKLALAKASDQSRPELIKKVRNALEDLNYKKEILLFRKFQLQKKQNRGIFLINGSKYYGQNWLYRLLLKPVRGQRGNEALREVVIDFSGQISIDMFWFLMYDQFNVSEGENKSESKRKLLETITHIWENDRSLVFRIEMNGDIPPMDLLAFIQEFWLPLHQHTEAKNSENMLLLFLIFGQTFDHQSAVSEQQEAVFATDLNDQWKPGSPLVFDIGLLDQNEVLRWLEGRINHFDDILDLDEMTQQLMKNQPTIFPEIVMIGFCMHYKLSFQNQILAKN